MSEVPRFKTFRDLRSLPAKSKEKSSDTGTPSIPSNTSSSSSTSLSGITRLSSRASVSKNISSPKIVNVNKDSEISPTKDFQKIPNSVPRSLDMFRGKSKQVWDYLWHVSRGSINPARKIRKSRKEIKAGAALGSMVTVDSAIEHLINVRLLRVNQSIGSLGGNEYEIFTPEEILTSYTSSASITSFTQKVDNLDILESSISRTAQTVEEIDAYTNAKTSFKDNTKNDDEGIAPFSEFLEKISAACKRITGKPTTKREREKWGTLADLLILEFESAARRTDSISSAPAFLTEVLRRKLLNASTISTNSKTQKAKHDTVGKPDAAGAYEIKVLDEPGRESTLEYLREFADSPFLVDFKKWYVEEDWLWLMEKLGVETKEGK